MATLQTFGIIIFFGIVLFVLGRQYNNYPLGIFGGLTVFTSGVLMLLFPLVNVSTDVNTVIGFLLFGVGAYMWVTGTTEVIEVLMGGDDV